MSDAKLPGGLNRGIEPTGFVTGSHIRVVLTNEKPTRNSQQFFV
jgi:hypothetical protein